MYEDSGFQGGKQLQVLEKDISLRSDHVRRIDEQDVALFQLAEQRFVHVLNPLADHLNPCLFQPGLFVRLDTDLPALVVWAFLLVSLDGLSCHQGRIAASDFEYTLGFLRPYQVVPIFSVAAFKSLIVEMKGKGVDWMIWNAVEFVIVLKIFEQAQLFSSVPLDARKTANLIQRSGQVACIKERLIVMIPNGEHTNRE